MLSGDLISLRSRLKISRSDDEFTPHRAHNKTVLQMVPLWGILLIFCTTTWASYCGKSGVPFSIEVLPSGQFVLQKQPFIFCQAQGNDFQDHRCLDVHSRHVWLNLQMTLMTACSTPTRRVKLTAFSEKATRLIRATFRRTNYEL